jgi:hypothetical protein
MNLRVAQKELRSRGPEVTPKVLALEAIIVLSISMVLVGVFA